jgi:hypothetical protein
MKDKTNLKIIIAVIVSIIVSSGITAFATIQVQANQINYNNTTVADALDGMYRINSFQTDYSTEEKVVGKWIDGKPIYQKTLTGTFTSSANQSIPHGIANFEQAINVFGYLESSSSNVDYNIPIGFYNGTQYFGVFFDSTNLQARIQTVYYGRSYNITVQYTKTTDSPSNN